MVSNLGKTLDNIQKKIGITYKNKKNRHKKTRIC